MNVRLAGGLLCLMVVACASANYRTPGAGVSPQVLAKADGDIAEVMKREPTAVFPARVAIARIEAAGYQTRGAQCYGTGRMCLVTAREVESDQDLARIASLPMVAAAAPLGRLLLPEALNSTKDLRLAAASMKADLLLVYSIDTRFEVESTSIGPLQLVSLGLLPTEKAHVFATASAALFDVRTGFVYGVAESTATEEQRANLWSTAEAVDDSRLRAEAQAFRSMLSEFEKLWQGIVREHAHAAN
jgi:hypothetical protein